MASINDWADFWRYFIGRDPIPANSNNKNTHIEWSEYQNDSVSEIQHTEWKMKNEFKNGVAVILGQIHRGNTKENISLV